MAVRQKDNRQNRMGIFLYYESPTNERISAYLRTWEPVPYWGKIQGVKTNSQVVSRLIPMELQEGAESWLILYRANLTEELLVFPFPDTKTPSIPDDPQKFGNYLSSLLEYIYGGSRNWYPYNGFRNLIDYIQRAKTYPFPHPTPPKRFQVVCYNNPLDELLKKPKIRFYDEDQREIVSTFTEVSEHIQQTRDEVLTAVLTAKNEEEIRRLLEDFELTLLEQSERLSEKVDRVVPAIVEHFGELMDDETKSFLISAETVFHFAKKTLHYDFDYSICGCGLWKSIERELNSSLIWHLRRAKNIADNNRKPIATISPSLRVDYEAGNQTVNINERQRGSIDFEGKMLGNIEWLLRTAQNNNIAGEVKPVFENDQEVFDFLLGLDKNGLPSLIEQVRKIRNGHAHIKTMNKNTYEELRSIVITSEGNIQASLLAKILMMKRAMEKYWSEN